MQGRQEIFNRLVFGPEVAVQHAYIGDRTFSLLNDELIQRRESFKTVARIV